MRRINKSWALFIYAMLLQFLTEARADETLYLEIVINGRNTTHIAEVIRRDNDWEMSYSELVTLGLKLNMVGKERIRLSEIPGATVTYDAEFQRLLINVPANILPTQYFGANIPSASSSPPRRDTGAFLNYNLVSIRGNVDDKLSSLWHELHVFNNNFFVVSNGILQSTQGRLSLSDYTRFETYYQRDYESDLHTLTIGDVINATPYWGRSVRMGGFRIARDYELNPSLITYPLPEFYGESALPGSIDLIINDQVRWREEATSGPFFINAVPYISGAGVAEVITTNMQGQQNRQSVNFYVTSQLLAVDMMDYDITVGFKREDFGFRSNSYSDKPIVSTSFRYGLTKYATPQLLIQSGEGLQLAGLGVTLLASSFGVFDIAGASSNYINNGRRESGNQASMSYNYTYERISVNAAYLRRYGKYRDLGTQDESMQNSLLPTTQMQAAISLHDNKSGSFNLGYFRITDKQKETRSALSFSWTRSNPSDVTTFLNISRTLFGKHENIISLTVSLPLGTRGQISGSTQQDANHEWHSQLQAMSNAPYTGGLGWAASVDDSPDKNRYFLGDWRNKYSEISMSVYERRHQTQYTSTLTGALIYMDKAIYPTRFVTDSFALVDADQSDVAVMIGHQVIGKTDNNGKLLVPDLDSYLENRLSIDPMLLPPNAVMGSIEQLVTPRRKGGVHVKFPIAFSQSALVQVVTADQQPLPAGALLEDRDSDKNFTAGWDGDVYIENLNEPLILFWAEGECIVEIKPAENKAIALPRLGPFICRPAKEAN